MKGLKLTAFYFLMTSILLLPLTLISIYGISGISYQNFESEGMTSYEPKVEGIYIIGVEPINNNTINDIEERVFSTKEIQLRRDTSYMSTVQISDGDNYTLKVDDGEEVSFILSFTISNLDKSEAMVPFLLSMAFVLMFGLGALLGLLAIILSIAHKLLTKDFVDK